MSKKQKKQPLPFTGRYVAIPHSLIDSEGFRALSGNAVKAYLFVYRRHNGSNNGEIHCSVREVSRGIGVCINTACTALKELQQLGLLRVTHGSSFDTRKTNISNQWSITCEEGSAWPALRWKSSSDDYPVFDGSRST